MIERSETVKDTCLWTLAVLLLYIYIIILALWYLPLSGNCQGARAPIIVHHIQRTPNADFIPMFILLTLYNIDD